MPFRTATVGRYLTPTRFSFFSIHSFSFSLVPVRFVCTLVIILLPDCLLLCICMLSACVGTRLVPTLYSGESLRCPSVEPASGISWDRDVARSGTAASRRGLIFEYSVSTTETKVLMKCLNDEQTYPGKTLLWTQQQHYTCAFKIAPNRRTSLPVSWSSVDAPMGAYKLCVLVRDCVRVLVKSDAESLLCWMCLVVTILYLIYQDW